MKPDEPSAGDTVVACPECDSSAVKRNVGTTLQGPKRDVTKYRCEDCSHPFDAFDAVHRERKIDVLPRGDSIARALHDADPDDLVTDGGHGNHYNVDGERSSPEDEDDVVLERRTTIQRHDDGGLLIPDGGSTEDEWRPGTCDVCGHTRDYTRTEDGQVICILCEDGVTDAAQEDELVTDGGRVEYDVYEYEEEGQRRIDDKHARRARELARDAIYIEARREASKIQHYPRCNDVLDEVTRQERRDGSLRTDGGETPARCVDGTDQSADEIIWLLFDGIGRYRIFLQIGQAKTLRPLWSSSTAVSLQFWHEIMRSLTSGLSWYKLAPPLSVRNVVSSPDTDRSGGDGR